MQCLTRCLIGTLMVLCPLQNPYSVTGLTGIEKVVSYMRRENKNPIARGISLGHRYLILLSAYAAIFFNYYTSFNKKK
jgi:hypothetical protein